MVFSKTIIFICVYMVMLFILIYTYINHADFRTNVIGIGSLLSSGTIALGIINYIDNNNKHIAQEQINNTKDYINFISGSFDKIHSFFLTNPKELHNLFYEFYGYNNFPINNNISDTNITTIEYITILQIIQYIETIYNINKNIFEDIYFRNRILNYTRSAKFRYVFSYTKNNYPHDFSKKMDELNIINNKDIEIEKFNIPILSV